VSIAHGDAVIAESVAAARAAFAAGT